MNRPQFATKKKKRRRNKSTHAKREAIPRSSCLAPSPDPTLDTTRSGGAPPILASAGLLGSPSCADPKHTKQLIQEPTRCGRIGRRRLPGGGSLGGACSRSAGGSVPKPGFLSGRGRGFGGAAARSGRGVSGGGGGEWDGSYGKEEEEEESQLWGREKGREGAHIHFPFLCCLPRLLLLIFAALHCIHSPKRIHLPGCPGDWCCC
jgi:hypothetical protein